MAQEIHESFEKHEYTLGVFVDLSKDFDMVDHEILIKKLSFFGINGLNLQWFPPHSKDNIPLKLPALTINGTEIKRETVIKFLGVLLDENFTWKNHIDYIQKKISTNVGLLYQSRYFLDEKITKQLYFSFINSYLNYGNIAWGEALVKVNLKQYFEGKNTHQELSILKTNTLTPDL